MRPNKKHEDSPRVAARRPDGTHDLAIEKHILRFLENLGDLRSEVKALRSESKELRKEIRQLKETSGEYLDIHGVAKLLKVSPRTVDTYAGAGFIPPPLYIGGSKRWERETIMAHIRSKATRRAVR